MLLEALNENFLRSNNTIYVGDSSTDLEAAQSAGIRWIHILNEETRICALHPELIQGSCMSRSELLAFFEELGGAPC
jgi:phosphoglycolate phosphatase-like HAD superfamily hydrolase